MRNFWMGVFVGVIATLLLGGLLGFAMTRQVRADAQGGGMGPVFLIRGVFGHHGEFGTIDEIGDASLTLMERSGVRQVLAIGDDTEIYRGKTRITLAELSKGQHVIVITAEQPDGTLKAKLVRVMSAGMLFQPFKPAGT